MSIPTIPITINNRIYEVRANASVLQACEEALIDIPRFCYHEKLSVAGNCRMCLVEVQKSPKPVVSCAMPVSKGMIIYTDTPLVKKAREAVLEFLLINHPLDCPICDQGGECDLQDETLHYGSDRGRYTEFKRSVEDKECGPIIKTIMTRCIHCTRCVRFAAEITGQEVLGAFGRGSDTEIGTYVQSFIKTELSGNLVDLCPVGALTSKPYAFTSRPWELQKNDTIDFFDAICSDISVQTNKISPTSFQNGKSYISSKENIVRILPKTQSYLSDNWISDKTRYAFDSLNIQRAIFPTKIDRKGNTKKLNWLDTLFDLAEILELNHYHIFHKDLKVFSTKKLVAILGPINDLQTIYLTSLFIKLWGSSDVQDGNYKMNFIVDLPSFYGLNHTFSSLDTINALLLIGTNPRFEASQYNTQLRKQQIRRGIRYVTINNYNSLNYRHMHQGNSLRTLIALAENKIKLSKEYYNLLTPSIILGGESLRNKEGYFLQHMTNFLGKKLISKTNKGERVGILHSNITSINMAHLGITNNVKSILNVSEDTDKKINTLFTIQMNNLNQKKWLSNSEYTNIISFSTHKNNNIPYDYLIPIKSLYEKNGLTFNIETRLRKFNKVINAPSETRTLESLFIALSRMQYSPTFAMSSIWTFFNQINPQMFLERPSTTFNFNLFELHEKRIRSSFMLFSPTVSNFYMTDVISSNSSTMGECSLFLTQNNNNSSFSY